jgi:Aspartyl protease
MVFAKRLAVLFAVGLATQAVSPPHESLVQLLARMRERSGPVWGAHLSSTSHLTDNGETVDLRSESQGLRFATYRCNGGICAGTYFDGERLFEININGTTLPDADGSDPLLRAERTVASLSFLDPEFTARGGHIIDDGPTMISDVAYRTLLISNGDAVPMLVYVDPKTAAVTYMRDVNGDLTLEYRDYVQVAGRYVLPLEVYRNGALFERYDQRGALTTAFETPHGPVPAFSSRPAAVATDPDRATPVFTCTLGGIVTKCLLDSGNSGLSVSSALAQELNAPTIGSFQVRGLGDYATEVVRAGELQAGAMTLPAANYVVLHDIDRFGYQVVLGADVFGATTVQLDNAAHRVVFGASAPQSGYTVPLAFDNFVPVVDVHLGTLPASLALDTGDESSINLAYDFYQAHHDLFPPVEQRRVGGVGGSSVEVMGTIPLVQIGGYSIQSSDIGATQNLQGTALGHLGAGLLAHFNVTIDYAAGELHFTPLAAPSPGATP